MNKKKPLRPIIEVLRDFDTALLATSAKLGCVR